MGIRELSPELAKVARDELGEVPERIPADLQAIKDWLAKQTHINARTDDQWLIAFLRGCKFSLERTKEKLDNYYSMRNFFPEITLGFEPMDARMQALMKSGVSLILPKPCSPSGPRVLLFRPACIDTNEFTIVDCMLLNNMITDMLTFDDDHTVVAGTHIVVDMKGASMSIFSYFTQMSPATMKRMFASGQDAVPIRQKGGHHINTPPGMETMFNLFKTFMSEKLKKRMFVHNQDMEALYQYVPKDILPAEYGGNGGTLSEITEQTKARMERYCDFFRENLNFKTDESKRPGKPKTFETSDGIEGSFRQLNVD